MAQVVERLLETTVDQLRTFQKLDVLTEHEAKQVSHKRRNLEIDLLRKGVTPKHYFRYIQYEHNVQLLLKRRVQNLSSKGVTQSEKRMLKKALFLQGSRILFLFNRASRKFPSDKTVWKNYFKYCLRTDSFRMASRVLGKALARLPNSEELWLIAISFEFDRRKNMRAARTIAQKALRQLENSQLLWKEYFRIELYYLCRQIFQRQYLGLPIPQQEQVDIPEVVAEESPNNNRETTDGLIMLQDSDGEEENEEDQLVLDDELNLVYQDISQQSSVSIENSKEMSANKTSSIPLSFWEGGVVLLILKHILERWKSDDLFLASLVELVMETPFTPEVLKYEMRNVVLSQLRPYENCRLSLVKGWFKVESSFTQHAEILEQLKDIVRDIPKPDVLKRCCELMDSFSMNDDLRASFLDWSNSLNVSLLEHSGAGSDAIQQEPLKSLIERWQHRQDEKELKEIENVILNRMEREIFHNEDASVDTEQALVSIQFLSGEMGTLKSLNKLECVERIRRLYDRILQIHPMNVPVTKMAIHVEGKCMENNQSFQRLRRLFEAWCEVEGSTNIDCWLQYIAFERKYGESHNVTRLYWKAMKMLQNKVEFMERYSLLLVC